MSRQPAPGVYERLITRAVEDELQLIEPELLRRARLNPADSHEVLARHVAALTRRALRAVADRSDERESLSREIALANRIAAAIGQLGGDITDSDHVVTSAEQLLTAILARRGAAEPIRPATPMGASALLVNGHGQPSVGTELRNEIASADKVDLICAFITWPGIRMFEEALATLADQGGRLRVITTTYLGATDPRALDRLVQLGAEVKVSYDTRSTRLHAKAWLFRRRSGFDTAYVGSSNLSKPAQTTGLEWNVRLSAVEQPHLIDTFEATFDEYWASRDFEDYRPDRDAGRLREAISQEREGPRDLPLRISRIEVRPWGYQQEVLDELTAERELHERWRNLVVMATGTGKTVVAGLDYQRLREAGTVDSLLFVAHRQEILTQSRSVFRHILRDGSFGELLGYGERPRQWRHVFGTIQSLASQDIDADAYDMVIVDEFHHAAAASYRSLLSRVRPRVLLGLTATPERTDGQDVRDYFDGRISAELRLWEALERGLLAPFQYFGVADDTDLSRLTWRRGGYATAELERIYTADHSRVGMIVKQLEDRVLDVGRMRAVAFCVSIAHAEFMARELTRRGIPARAVTSDSGSEVRADAVEALRDRRVNVLCTVDLFNEGVDLPEIDTILLLRPTESATVFLQQLGRGLRIAEGKPCLTVLDLIGAQHQKFRFDLRFRALSGVVRRDLVREIELAFPSLPAGCHITLDEVARGHVLDNVRRSLRRPWAELVAELRSSAERSLATFLADAGLEPPDLYRTGRGGWTGLRRAAGLERRPAGLDDAMLSRAIGRLLHADDPERLGLWSRLLMWEAPPSLAGRPIRERRLLRMLHTALFGHEERPEAFDEAMRRLWQHPARREELAEIASVLRDGLRRVTPPLDDETPLRLHARYSRYEALRAFGDETVRFNEGVRHVPHAGADLFFVTLDKSGQQFSPTTMYADHAISPELFQWESQSTTSDTSPTAQRYIAHEERGQTIHLFLREHNITDRALGTPPFHYAGPMTYVDHTGSRPVRFVWRLAHALPADVFHAAKITRG
jgi:superfamily II DNA or RNA helicase/HKD family nuclease